MKNSFITFLLIVKLIYFKLPLGSFQKINSSHSLVRFGGFEEIF